MRQVFALIAILYSTAAIAQAGPPPTVGGRPLVQIKPHGAAMKPKPQSIAVRLQACLEVDDETKERLDCYDAIITPKPNPKAPAAKGVMDCRFVKEEDERLRCFNGFTELIPKLPK
jgi:hypothetical protein